MHMLIDSHQDLAYNILTFNRDYRRAAHETRQREQGGFTPQVNGDTLLGWADYQRGKVALVFSTIFVPPAKFSGGSWDILAYASSQEAIQNMRRQVEVYQNITAQNPDYYRLITNRAELASLWSGWQTDQAGSEEHPCPVGWMMSIESAEGLNSPAELEWFWEQGVRAVGPVWGGTRYCGGTLEGDQFTDEGKALLKQMEHLGFALDISHMNERSTLQALDLYHGVVFASHANARSLLRQPPNERHFTDATITRLVERDGVMGIIPYNQFLDTDWKPEDLNRRVSLKKVVEQIDHVCQLAGSAKHVAIGTDFDGGFGAQEVPFELDTIADLQKLAPMLHEIGYDDKDVEAIFCGNWRRKVEEILP